MYPTILHLVYIDRNNKIVIYSIPIYKVRELQFYLNETECVPDVQNSFINVSLSVLITIAALHVNETGSCSSKTTSTGPSVAFTVS